ncbi:uncharacterized protein TRIADDRAFT_59310 [Trichoplax adhaerens]|uniref:SAM domain-containing protein n=1 Tax=Trichoplax adhaerens TaxID=10228 RepID=B3S4Q7_TRIAD|nr:hypothetical protein TRIADDRAFT_59310 [Trichoplax adhaerens]EDV22128.1 hypothetical protein TRIADDRAFT_59310 [Trichoplax adhaerens]|eukprot:XP_002115283.1 hypothetical protein TRIADDRAFT_59310 [Trichoplax adhaerens]
MDVVINIFLDPHIRVIGKPENVQLAKEKIMAILDTKSNRVTLKMDVSHTDHSHVIGKGGQNIKKVMQETGCHIHFPDSNRGSQGEKSNQVSIAGQPIGVESARAQIRELLPLVLAFEVHTGAQQSGRSLSDQFSSLIQQLIEKFNVTITFKQKPRLMATTVLVRGSQNNSTAVKEATATLIEALCGSVVSMIPVSVQLDIAPQHHTFIIGRGGSNIKNIMHRTGSSIHFPDTNAAPSKRSTVYITGEIEAVCRAREQLMGCLPLVLMFDMKEDIDTDQGLSNYLMETLDVYINIKPKPKQPSKSAIVKSVEKNAYNMYRARVQLLGIDPQQNPSQLPPPPISISENVDNNQRNGANYSKRQTPRASNYNNSGVSSTNSYNSNGLRGVQSPIPSPGSHSSGSASPINSPWFLGASPSTSPGYPMSPQNYDMMENSPSTIPERRNPMTAFPYPPNSGNTPHMPHMPPGLSPLNNQIRSQSPMLTAKDSTTITFRPNDYRNKGDLTTKGKKDYVKKAVNVSFNNKTRNIANDSDCNVGSLLPKEEGNRDTRSFSASSGENDSFTGRSNTGILSGINSSPLRSSSSSPDDVDYVDSPRSSGTIGDHRNMPNNTMQSHELDYERKKYLASLAMQTEVVPSKVRTPTYSWIGYGFSKSVPGSMLKKMMEEMNAPNAKPQKPILPSNTINLSSTLPNSQLMQQQNTNNIWSNDLSSTRDKQDFSTMSGTTCDVTDSDKQSYAGSEDLTKLFKKLGLEKYVNVFLQQEVDLQTFSTLTDADLKELGITTFGARRKMVTAISDIRKQNQQKVSLELATDSGKNGTSSSYMNDVSASLAGSVGYDDIGGRLQPHYPI